jgi:hypothetical protein
MLQTVQDLDDAVVHKKQGLRLGCVNKAVVQMNDEGGAKMRY